MIKRSQVTIEPTLALQCVGFMIGATLFAVGSAPWLSEAIGSEICNRLFFVGSWFFTGAAFIQLLLSGSIRNHRGALRALWLAAAMQFVGTLLFNISTGAAIDAQTVEQQIRNVWTPNAEGSAAFLISGFFALLVLFRSSNLWGPRNTEWYSNWINMLGCVAFGLSAFGALVLPDGSVKDGLLANLGTFIGAICFLVASAIVLPDALRKQRKQRKQRAERDQRDRRKEKTKHSR